MTQAKTTSWQLRLHEIIYESDTPAGKFFDVTLLILILSSIIVVIFDSIPSWHSSYGDLFEKIEWGFTIIFTIEYILRLICIKKPLRYVFSFLGLVDLLSILPGYLSLLFPGTRSLLVFRALRLYGSSGSLNFRILYPKCNFWRWRSKAVCERSAYSWSWFLRL